MSGREETIIGPPKLTRFEIARIVGARALQLSLGAPPLVDVSKAPARDPVAIALVELEEGVLPITIHRMRSDGSSRRVPLRKLLPGSREFIRRTLKSWNLY
ncbi:DNA-directed RNA polymerase subunit K [Desulfurococcaceae archaeon MEX13E-LK6-19]|nr:DNA-directed RNA polymerase subunit K [Desulfurococcaceae archaeon MEX13E-LK6-19]